MTETPSAEEVLLVGVIVAAFGLRGQVKMRTITDNVEHLHRNVRTLFIGPKRQPYRLKNVQVPKAGTAILTLEGVTERTAAEELRGMEVTIHERDAAPLAEDEYFIHDLYNLLVITEDGDEIGRVREVLETGSNEVLVVTRPGAADALIPMIHDVVSDLDISGGRITIRPIEGLL
ncbi:MAG: ribosome maturation factor RimM [Chloroflexota bacterium]|nr:MAG: 16S rRNA processing protein RimM [Chloroflexota bacterium]